MSAATNDRFRRVDAVFDAVLDLPTGEQAAYIDRECGDDGDLRAEVIQLLRAHHRTGSLLDTPPGYRLTSALLHDSPAPTADRIGPFRVVRAIGEGGMGQVFLGERADGQFEQRVAIKLIRHPMPGLVRRFLEERRILALLEHPNIARLVDGGITADGLPYFAMEFVDGEPIDRYCSSRDLSLDSRLALFEKVCDAVGYAHQHLVIHRDLKAKNILVTPNGDVKLLDFGIAKLLVAPDGQRREETWTGVRVMTPECAAPEQVVGDPISTATDVYALGVLLYSLVSGERPYELRGKSAGEVQHIICFQEPAPPSARTPAPLAKRIRGDLDLIVMTAMQKEPERRYHSPAALALDVQRFRQGHAIHARPDSARYRITKFVARHRAGVVIAGALVVATAVGATRERILRQRAEVEARKATEVENFLVRVFDVADPFAWSEADRGIISARDLLDRGAGRIDSTLVGQPEVQAELRSVLGRVYTNLGLFAKATPLLERSLAQRTTLRGSNDTSVATSMDLLGTALAQQDRFDDAERLLRSAVDQRRRALGRAHPLTAEAIGHLATLLDDRSRFAAAESLYREVLAIDRARFGDSTVEVAGALSDLALNQYHLARYAEAESLYRRALDIELRRRGERDATTAVVMQNLAQTLDSRGKRDEAERYYRRSLVAKRATLGDAHPSVTIGLNNLAVYLSTDPARLNEAEGLVREALALDRKIFGDRHTYVAEGLRNLGIILRGKGQFVRADSAIRAALSIDRGLLGERHLKMAALYNHLSQVRYQLGDSAEGIRLMRESVSRYRDLLGETHPFTLTTMGYLARQLSEAGGGVEAESLARTVLAHLDSSEKSQRVQYAATQRVLGAALLEQHRADDALPILKLALDITTRDAGEDNLRTAHAKLTYGSALIAKGRYAEATPVLRSADAVLQKHRTDQPRLAAQSATALAALGAIAKR
jgi:serine/threonine-protein kinase